MCIVKAGDLRPWQHQNGPDLVQPIPEVENLEEMLTEHFPFAKLTISNLDCIQSDMGNGVHENSIEHKNIPREAILKKVVFRYGLQDKSIIVEVYELFRQTPYLVEIYFHRITVEYGEIFCIEKIRMRNDIQLFVPNIQPWG